MIYPDDYIDHVICGDCMEVMQSIPDKSIDLIVNDPPYGLRKHEWDKIDDYMDWSMVWIKEAERVLKDSGSFYLFHGYMPVIGRWIVEIANATGFVYKNLLVWQKSFDGCYNKWLLDRRVGLSMNRSYRTMAEYILFYTFQDERGLSRIYDNRDSFGTLRQYLRDEWKVSGLSIEQIKSLCGYAGNMPYHWFALTIEAGGKSQWQLPTEAMYHKLQTTGFFQRPYETLRQEYESLRYTFNNQKTHHSVWNYNYVPNPDHPTQKPVELIENIIKHSSNEGDTVLDMFAGSGTTAVAAKNLDRHFIGIEKEKEYCDIARDRIADIDMVLFPQAAM